MKHYIQYLDSLNKGKNQISPIERKASRKESYSKQDEEEKIFVSALSQSETSKEVKTTFENNQWEVQNLEDIMNPYSKK